MEIVGLIISFFFDLITGALEGSKLCTAVLVVIGIAWIFSMMG